MKKENQPACSHKSRKSGDNDVFNIGMAGSGPLLKSVTAILRSPDFIESFPHVRVVGHIDTQREKSYTDKRPAYLRDIPFFTEHEEFFSRFPDVQIIVDTSRDNLEGELFSKCCPNGITIINTIATRFFVRAAQSGAISIAGEKRLKRTRDSFSVLIDQVDEDIIIMNENGAIVQSNAFFKDRMAELEADSSNFSSGSIKDDGTGVDGIVLCCGVSLVQAQHWRKTVLNGKKYSETFTKITTDGRVQYLRIYLFKMFGEHGENLVMLMQRDITERTSIEQRLQQSEKMAAIGDLSTYIAHEIRNPLFAIGGFANALLRSPSLDEGAREKARIILEESQRLDGILKSILNFARPTDSSVGEVDAVLVLQQTSELMRIGESSRGIKTELDIPATLPKIRGNADQIKQCLINLIKNSQEAMPEGGVLLLRAFVENNMVCLSVSDTGIGIPAESQKQIFSPFFSTKSKGAGLGLAMTKKIIEEAGGKVVLNSQIGKGTTITLCFIPALAVQEE